MRITSFLARAALGAGLLAVVLGVGALTTTAEAQQRYVTVNGMLLGPQELAVADRNAGFRVPNGHYWYDVQSGYWGAVGGPALGRVPAHLRQGGGGGGSHRNSNVGVGAITNPDGATWKDQVGIVWD